MCRRDAFEFFHCVQKLNKDLTINNFTECKYNFTEYCYISAAIYKSQKTKTFMVPAITYFYVYNFCKPFINVVLYFFKCLRKRI